MRSLRFIGALAVPLALASACSKSEKPDAFIVATQKAAAGEPQALFDALPASYQKDAQGVVAAFAAKIPAQPWNDSFSLLAKLSKVFETKKDFVLGHPALKGMVKPEDVAKGWDPLVHMVSTVANSDIKTADGMKKLDIRAYMAGPLAQVIADFEKAAEVAANVPGGGAGAAKFSKMKNSLKTAKITIEKEEGDHATVKVEMEGEKTETTEMVKVEGKWIPKELADGWPKAMAEAKAGIEKMNVEPAMIAQFNAMKGMIDPALDGLLAAKTQDEFNAQIDGVMKAVMGSRGGARGGEIAEAPAGDVPPPDVAAPAPAPAEAPKAAPVNMKIPKKLQIIKKKR
ncbi:MAG: hypothetical protein U1E65_15930 [Myxococcota bacterium]